MYTDRALPGLHPNHIGLQFDLRPDGTWDLRVYLADRPGLRDRANSDLYEFLCPEEALDVAVAVLDGALGHGASRRV